MKKFIFIFLISISLIIFQTSFLAPWLGGYFSPSPLLVTLMAGVVIFGFNQIWGGVILAGLLADALNYSRLGSHVVIFIFCAYLISFVSRRFSVSDKGLGMVIAFFWVLLATWIENWALIFLENWGNQKMFFSFDLVKSFGAATLINIGLFFVSYYFLKKIKRYYYPAEFKFNR
jgi:rod shape-determining protein MreD